MEKTCTKCGETKPLTEFYKQKLGKNGIRPSCKACCNAYNTTWRKANPDKVKTNYAKWYQTNPGKGAAAARRWQKANPDRRKANTAAWRKANPDKVKAMQTRTYLVNRDKYITKAAEWAKANPEKARASSLKSSRTNPHFGWEREYRTRCHRLGLDLVIVSFTREDLIAKYGNACFYCNDGAFEQLDHYLCVAAGGPHTLANARPCCRTCNMRKCHAIDRADIAAFRRATGRDQDDINTFRRRA